MARRGYRAGLVGPIKEVRGGISTYPYVLIFRIIIRILTVGTPIIRVVIITSKKIIIKRASPSLLLTNAKGCAIMDLGVGFAPGWA